MDLHLLLVIGHVVGTALGVGGATIAEVQYMRALKDGSVDAGEGRMLHTTYWAIRAGLILIIISGAVLVWWHLSQGNQWVITSSKIWAKDAITLIIILNAVLLTIKKIPMWLGASISLTSWYAATVLGLWRGVPYTFVQIMIGYAVAVAIVAVVLSVIKKLYLQKA